MKINTKEIKDLAPIKTVAILHVGDYSGISKTFAKLGEWAGKNNYWSAEPRMMGIYHDDPERVAPEQLRSHACLEDKGFEHSEGIERYEITGGKYFIMNAELTMAEYGDVWQIAYDAIAKQDLECDMRDHYELYISCVDGTQGEDAPWIVDFCIPVK